MKFKGVSNERRLERQLDNIIVGGLKLYVNVLKYGRGKARYEEPRVKPRTQVDDDNKEVAAARQMAPHCRASSMSYAKVVATSTMNVGQWRHPHTRTFRPDGSYSSVQLEIQVGEKKWYTDVWVSRLKKSGIFERVEDELLWEVGTNVVPKYLGHDMILLLGLSDTKVEELIIEETRHGSSPFYSLEKWNPTMRLRHRLVWAQCWGIPLEAWDIGQIRKIVATIGDLVEVDDDVEELRRLDKARVLIRTPWRLIFQHTVEVHISGEVHKVHIIEKNWSEAGKRIHHCRSAIRSSKEIDSDDSDNGTPKLKMSGEPGFHYSPRSFTDERIGEIESQQRATLSSGP